MRAIFFDLDDTIYNRAVPFQKTYTDMFGADTAKSYAAYLTCRTRGVECFDDSQTGRITMDEMYIYRYTKGFADIGMTITPEQALEFQRIYAGYQDHLELTNRMRTLLDYSRRHFDFVGIITNGPGQHQRDKMNALGIGRWLNPELVFISEECGSIKPDPTMFLEAQTTVGLSSVDMFYVGDSYTSDMVPAGRLGWNTIWLNRENSPIGSAGYEPDYVVTSEEDLWLILRNICG